MRKIDVDIPKLNYSTSEAYKSVRTNLKFCGEETKVIVLTSCYSEEGKSTVSLNLAKSLADSGERVVFIDADLRRSAIARTLNIMDEIDGLGHFLSGQTPLNDVLCTTNIPNLLMILAGPIPPNPAELLAGKGFHAMIEKLREVASYIIIDSPPLGQVIDSAIIAKECDGSFLILESGADSRRVAKEVKEQLVRTGCPFLGVILNKVKVEKKGHYGRYFGLKGDKYYGSYYGKK